MKLRLNLKSNLVTKLKSLSQQRDFTELAKLLLNQVVLNIKGTSYRLCELEMYCTCPEHPDDFTHCRPDQLTSGKLYFHKFANGSYKSGTFKGMDITLGDGHSIYFGILIRSMLNLTTGEFITGPSNSVTKLLSHFDCPDVKALISLLGQPVPLDILNTSNLIHLTEKELSEQTIYCGPRVGLSTKTSSDTSEDYRLRQYRYAIYTHKIKKQKQFTLL